MSLNKEPNQPLKVTKFPLVEQAALQINFNKYIQYKYYVNII